MYVYCKRYLSKAHTHEVYIQVNRVPYATSCSISLTLRTHPLPVQCFHKSLFEIIGMAQELIDKIFKKTKLDVIEQAFLSQCDTKKDDDERSEEVCSRKN